jgi:phospholipid/cholesterol/gamma-HCH transport system substrate-binding protein
MKLKNELKVGLALLVSAAVFLFGSRYFQDLPLFRGTYQLRTEFVDVGGLVEGHTVRVNGVSVGSVDAVMLNPETNRAQVRFHVNSDLKIPEGTRAKVSGISSFGVVTLDLKLGPQTNAAIPPDGLVEGDNESLLTMLADRTPELLGQADSILTGLNGTLGAARVQLAEPGSDLRTTLGAVRGSFDTLNDVLLAEQARLGRVLENVERLSGNLDRTVTTQGDSLGIAVSQLRRTLTQVDQNLASLRAATQGLDTLMTKLNRGDGTLGLLVNDPGLYHRADSTLANLNRLITDFQTNPKRYLKDLKLVDVF